jgi:hypothetical protein
VDVDAAVAEGMGTAKATGAGMGTVAVMVKGIDMGGRLVMGMAETMGTVVIVGMEGMVTMDKGGVNTKMVSQP